MLWSIAAAGELLMSRAATRVSAVDQRDDRARAGLTGSIAPPTSRRLSSTDDQAGGAWIYSRRSSEDRRAGSKATLIQLAAPLAAQLRVSHFRDHGARMLDAVVEPADGG